ncbi:vWA domain-containing protein [Collinsella intestinalis]|uniref:vWA domain-containing protein n=1 Tax=Collinsella intestinalis TaxID=147207 RepID=UPI0025A46346|nr:VWA-like domain-containing protein [Collinsella intestinalis]MDM8164264.1 VWA-like domain-containing protein [Collinsella intestinalis]
MESIATIHQEMRELVEGYQREPQPQILQRLDRGFQRFSQLATLFLVSERDTYYGYFFMSMSFRTNYSTDAIAGILLDVYPPVFEANPLLLFRLSLKEVMYAFCHEVDHVVFNHPAEMVRTNPERDPGLFKLFNYAADASVNDQLNYEIAQGKKFLSPPKGVITSEFLAKRFGLSKLAPRQDYLYYFNRIKDRVNASDDSEEASRRSGTAQKNAAPDGRQGQKGFSIGNHTWELASGEDGGDTGALDEMLESATKELLNNVNDLMDEEARSMMPARFTERIAQINEPPRLNWKQLLKQYVGTISAEKLKTRSRLNRRQPMRYDLSGTKESKTLKIAVAIDTSASMDAEQLKSVFTEIFAIVAHRRYEITVIECDASIQNVYRVKSPEDVRFDVAGRGGTLFTPAIAYINENRYFRDALLIYFTDGFGEQQIPRPRTYRNLWIILGPTKHLSVENPYGIVLPMED